MKLSERVASGENTPELREAIAVMAGWKERNQYHETKPLPPFAQWARDGKTLRDCPDYMADIRLPLSDSERRGWAFGFGGNDEAVQAWVKHCPGVSRKDRDLARCACEALVVALENDDGK